MTIITNSTREESSFCSGETIVTNQSGVEWVRLFRDAWGLIFTAGGEGNVCLDNEAFTLKRGDIALMSPECIPSFRAGTNWSIVWFRFLLRPHMAEKMSSLKDAPPISIAHLPVPEYRRARHNLLEAHFLGFQRERGWYELAYMLLETVLVRFDNAIAADQNAADQRIVTAQKLLTAPGEPLSIDEVARRCGMSRAVLYQTFKQTVGVTPRHYREIHLFNRAKQLLVNTSWPIAEVARQISIEDPFYFSARFKHFTGQSPSDYRSRPGNPSSNNRLQ